MESKTILFYLIGTPYQSDMTTTLFRLIEAALGQNHRVIVWACGGATYLTMNTLGERKPRNFIKLNVDYPSTAALVEAMFARSNGRLEWWVCRHCMEDRGTENQISRVKVQPPHRFFQYRQRADVCLAIRHE